MIECELLLGQGGLYVRKIQYVSKISIANVVQVAVYLIYWELVSLPIAKCLIIN